MSNFLSGASQIVSSGVKGLVTTTETTASLVVDEVEDVVETLLTKGVGLTENVSSMDFLPGLDSLGCGYNVLKGYYADPRSCKSNLFIFNDNSTSDLVRYTFNGTSYAAHKDVLVVSTSGSSLFVVSGNSIEEYITSISAKVSVEGSYSFFSASVSASIGTSTAKNVEKTFTRVQENIRHYTLQLPSSRSLLRSFLRPEVRDDIDNAVDLWTLFDNYGTHFVQGILMGGRATYTCSTSKTKFHSTTDIKTVAEMSYKALAGSLSASVEAQYKKDIDSFRANSEKKVETSGGDPALGGDSYVQNPQAWKNSVKDDVAFVDFVGEGLVAIWELALTTDRRKTLEEFYPEYCKERQESFVLPEPYLKARKVALVKAQFEDRGSGAKKDLAAAVPEIGNGWYYLGQVAISGKADAVTGADETIVVKEIVPDSGFLVEVDHWEAVWTDEGSGLTKNYDLWRGVSGDPVDYYVVGDFFHVNSIHTTRPPPSAEEAAGIRAVHRRCLVPGSVGTQVWNSQGMTSNSGAGVWEITAAAAGEAALDVNGAKGPFVSVASATDIPARPVYVLKASAVIFESD